MGIFLNPGNVGFKQIISEDTYVDKTGIIAYLNRWLNKSTRYVCVSRARRFGKTVAAQTIQAYYDNSCDSRALFAPYEIARDSSFEEHINKYDVIGLDVQSFFLLDDDPQAFIKRLETAVLEEVCAKWSDIDGLKDVSFRCCAFMPKMSTTSSASFQPARALPISSYCPKRASKIPPSSSNSNSTKMSKRQSIKFTTTNIRGGSPISMAI